MDSSLIKIDQTYVRKRIKRRLPSTHKGNYGHVLVVAGWAGMAGACSLTAEAALRTGSGLVYVCTLEKNFPVMQIRVPEAICVTEEQAKAKLKDPVPMPGAGFSSYDVIAFGPGMGTGDEAKAMLAFILDNYRGPLVLDADGLNMIAEDDELRQKFFAYSGSKVITPHQGEAVRLLSGARLGTGDREDVAAALSVGYDTITVLKGPGTLVARRNGAEMEIMQNTTGGPGMATAGSGDVLTGVIASLAGQKLDLFEAAACGVYLHGRAGDIATEEKGEYGLISRDIVQCIPYSIKEFLNKGL
ncbi:MAG: NAD(P)H-hydrate dehydratase [Eubacterium sp.]|nr:NAD(P)H-hydrate dehydratase [Eubacterium sp.]